VFAVTQAREPLNLDRVANLGLATDGPAAAEEAEPTKPGRQQEIVTRDACEAELENYRRRERKEMDEHEARARGTIILDFLEIADALDRATAAWKEGGGSNLKSVQAGIESVLRLFHSKLEHYAVTAFEAEGKPFDPRVHHAVSRSTSTDTTPGTVLYEVQKGYLMGGQLLRPAAVVVASEPAKTSEVGASAEEPRAGDDPASDWHGYLRNRR
jgi:molecular chaperone GrpE